MGHRNSIVQVDNHCEVVITPSDIEVIRKRLTVEHLIDKTIVFFDNQRKMGNAEVAARFEGYWRTWIEQDLELLFKYVQETLIFESRGLQFMYVPGGVKIFGDGFTRTVMNSWHD